VIPVFNRLNHTINCINSLLLQSYKNFQIIVIDDNSFDGTFDFITRNYPSVAVLKGNGNLWWTGGTNMGVKWALERANDNDYILTLNNDTTVKENFLIHIIETAIKIPHSIIGSLCVFIDNPNLIKTSGFIMDWNKSSSRSLAKFVESKKPNQHGIKEITHTCGKGTLIPVSAFRKIGLYDQINFPHYHADTAFTLKAHLNGYKIYLDYDSIVFSDVKASGIGSKNSKPSLCEFWASLFFIKSVNNVHIRLNFARQFFPDKKFKYLSKIYIKTFGGFIKRYL